MTTRKGIQISILFLFFVSILPAQKVNAVYKAADLFKRMEPTDTTYILNFWATWCKPCMQELQAIDSVGISLKDTKTKLIFVNLDFKEKKNQVTSALKNKGIQSECVLLDEVNGNVYIDRISQDWTGSIPATLIKKAKQQILVDKKLSSEQLHSALQKFESASQ